MLQSLAVFTECFDDFVVATLAVNRIKINHTAIHLRVDIHRSNGHHREPIVIQLGEFFGNHLAQSFAESCRAFVSTTVLSIGGATARTRHNNYAK